jgi:cation diffusion facilitator CzcD-associated flavoprotein CzcO
MEFGLLGYPLGLPERCQQLIGARNELCGATMLRPRLSPSQRIAMVDANTARDSHRLAAVYQYEMERNQIPVCVLGAGPYGLSVAAHLQGRRTAARTFGDPLSAWRKNAPRQMFLKSVASASSLSAPTRGYTLNDFCAAAGESQLTDHDPIPNDLFVRYGLWFQENVVPGVEREMAREVTKNGRFQIVLDSGERVEAGAVVVATGHVKFAHVPAELRALVPDGPGANGHISHSSQHQDFARFAGREVAVLGAGQSALETAALLNEAGATVHALARRQRVLWANPPVNGAGPPPFWRRKRESPLGPGWPLYALSYGPQLVARLPSSSRRMLVRKILGPSGAWWLRDRVVGVIDLREDWHLEHAEAQDGRVRLRGRLGSGGHDELVVDHVIASTGYRVDVDALDYLSPELRGQVRKAYGWPRLSRWGESSVPGLFFTGLPSAATFGPLMRFVAGTRFAAPQTAAAAAAAGLR